jgi:hypothetical protein
MNLIVFSSVVAAALFLALWLARPDLRRWIEAPKYRFQAAIHAYDTVRDPAYDQERVEGDPAHSQAEKNRWEKQ